MRGGSLRAALFALVAFWLGWANYACYARCIVIMFR